MNMFFLVKSFAISLSHREANLGQTYGILFDGSGVAVLAFAALVAVPARVDSVDSCNYVACNPSLPRGLCGAADVTNISTWEASPTLRRVCDNVLPAGNSINTRY
jgi:hypothetical protein